MDCEIYTKRKFELLGLLAIVGSYATTAWAIYEFSIENLLLWSIGISYLVLNLYFVLTISNKSGLWFDESIIGRGKYKL